MSGEQERKTRRGKKRFCTQKTCTGSIDRQEAERKKRRRGEEEKRRRGEEEKRRRGEEKVGRNYYTLFFF